MSVTDRRALLGAALAAASCLALAAMGVDVLTSIAAVLLNLFFNGAKGDAAGSIEAAKAAEAH